MHYAWYEVTLCSSNDLFQAENSAKRTKLQEIEAVVGRVSMAYLVALWSLRCSVLLLSGARSPDSHEADARCPED